MYDPQSMPEIPGPSGPTPLRFKLGVTSPFAAVTASLAATSIPPLARAAQATLVVSTAAMLLTCSGMLAFIAFSVGRSPLRGRRDG